MGSGAESLVCPRCDTRNAAHMRFCNNCGFQLKSVAAEPARAPVEPASSPGAPLSGAGASGEASTPGAGAACWRCRGVGDPGADFCKYCGARYADGIPVARAGGAPLPAASSPTVSAPTALAPAVAVSAVAPPAVEEPARLVSILKDGSDGTSYTLREEQIDIGREEGQIVLNEDPYLSPRHARLGRRGDALVLTDLDSVNGVYIRLREPVELHDGSMVLLGQQVLRFDLLPEGELPLGPAVQRGVLIFGTPDAKPIARLTQQTTEGIGRDVYYLYRDETVVGREQGDIVFTDDPFMSRRHASITIERGNRRFMLRDLGSSNGTAIRFRGERVLKPGDQFRVGRHLFRYDAGGMRGGR